MTYFTWPAEVQASVISAVGTMVVALGAGYVGWRNVIREIHQRRRADRNHELFLAKLRGAEQFLIEVRRVAHRLRMAAFDYSSSAHLAAAQTVEGRFALARRVQAAMADYGQSGELIDDGLVEHREAVRREIMDLWHVLSFATLDPYQKQKAEEVTAVQERVDNAKERFRKEFSEWRKSEARGINKRKRLK